MTRAAARFTTLLRGSPFTLIAVAGLWTLGIASNAIVHGPTLSLLSKHNLGLPVFNLHGSWYPFASRLWCADLAGYIVTTVLLLALCAPAERLLGPKRTAGVFFCTLLGTTAAAALLATISTNLRAPGSAGLHASSADGPLIGAVGVILAATFLVSRTWRRRLCIVFIVPLATLVLYSGQLQDVLRLMAGLTGLFVGSMLRQPAPAGVRHRRFSSIEAQESRLLVALVVVAVAAGPFILLINRAANGFGAHLGSLWLAPPPTRAIVRRLCLPDVGGTCPTVFAYTASHSVGAEVRMALPMLIACVLAMGLWRGYRSAYLGALAFNLLLAVAGTFSSLSVAFGPTGVLRGSLRSSYLVRDLSADLVPAGVAALIYLLRSRFTVRSPQGAYRRLSSFVSAVFIGISAAYLVVGYLARSQFDRALGLGDLLRNLPSRFLPPTYLGLIQPRFRPMTGAAGELSDWTGAAFWIVVLGALFVTFQRGGAFEHRSEPEKIRRLLSEHGGSNLAYMSNWEGHDHWVSSDGRSAFAYRVIGAVAITTGEPLGDSAQRATAVREFTQFCATNGWTPCLFCVSEYFLPTIEDQNWHALKVANDAVIHLEGFDLSGRRLQDVRTALNRAQKRDIRAEWIDLHEASPSVVHQIEQMGKNFAAVRGTPELSFTIGGVPELFDGETRCLVAIDPSGVVHGVVSWIPVFRAGETIGWTLDFMRRSPEGLKGVMDFLIASSALIFRAEGFEIMSLSGVPLPHDSLGASGSVAGTAIGGARSRLNQVFQFESLSAFKDKFRPRYEPLFMAYRDGMDLPRIAYAIARAYLPSVTLREAVALCRRVTTLEPTVIPMPLEDR